MFDFFSKRTAKDFAQQAKDAYQFTELPAQAKDPEVYRVGMTENGETTLTLLSPNGMTMTLIMSQDRCEQLIRMLQSTYTTQSKDAE